MPTRGSQYDTPYLFVGFDIEGAIIAAQIFLATPSQVLLAARTRAEIVGVTKYQTYQIRPTKSGDLEFRLL